MRWRTSEGFTLVEVLIASAMLMTAWLAAARLLTGAALANAVARAATRSTVLAAAKLEQLRATAFDDAALAPSPPGTLTADVGGYSDRPEPEFARRWSVELLPALPADGRVVTVLVSGPRGTDARLTTIRVRKPR
jgi:Tfp pilus assembly protein PilV